MTSAAGSQVQGPPKPPGPLPPRPSDELPQPGDPPRTL